MNKRTVAIITGCNGFTGRYLVSYLRNKRKSFMTIGLDISGCGGEGVDIFLKNRANYDFTRDIHDELVNAEKIICFHLAGIIFEKNENKMFVDNLNVTNQVFSSLMPYKEKTVVLNVGSSAEYGYQGRKQITERCTPKPVSGYGRSKLSQTFLANCYYSRYGLPVVFTKTFNIIGPGQGDKLVCGRFVKQAVSHKKGTVKKMSVGNLDTYRDFVDVRDAVSAYTLLAEKGRAGEIYNVASGHARGIRKVLRSILDAAEVSPEITEKASAGASDVPYQRASIKKINADTGWAPSFVFEDTVRDMVDLEEAA